MHRECRAEALSSKRGEAPSRVPVACLRHQPKRRRAGLVFLFFNLFLFLTSCLGWAALVFVTSVAYG